MINLILCNCYHSEQDHIDLGDAELPFISWCRYSEIGLCPCDSFSRMDNLEYLEYKYEQSKLDSKSYD